MYCKIHVENRYGPPEPYISFFNHSSNTQATGSILTGIQEQYTPPVNIDFYEFVGTHPYLISPESENVNKNHWAYLRKSISSATEEILEVLLPNYQRHERPNGLSLAPTIVNVFIHILAVSSISVVEMEYTVDMYLRQIWTDPRLAWNTIPSLMHYDQSILITSEKDSLWIPDLFFRNGKRGFMHHMSVPNYLIRVSPNGSVLFSQKITMTFSCSMYLKNFPIDRQECSMNLGSYGYTVDELRFVWLEKDPVTIQEHLRLLEFATPRQTDTVDCTANGTTSTGTYSCLLLTIPFKRLVSSYIVTTYIPEVLIVMVSWLGFWIDVKVVPARVTLGLFTLLGLLTEGSSVSSKLPRVTYIKAIDVWLTVCLLFVIAALVEFALAYMYAPKDSANEWETEVVGVIEKLLSMTLDDCRCCCCYTKSTTHKPTKRVDKVSVSHRLCTQKTSGTSSSTYHTSYGKKCTRRTGPPQSSSSELRKCNLCDSMQHKCCECSLCRQLQCIKAPKMPNTKSKHSRAHMERECTKKRIVNFESKPGSTYQQRIFLENRKPGSIRYRTKQVRPTKSSLKTREMSKKLLTEVAFSPNKKSKRSFTLSNVLKRIWRRILRTINRRNPRPAYSFTRIRSEVDIYDSEVDAYSRFLFPACFLLFNCGYWFFYLIVVDE